MRLNVLKLMAVVSLSSSAAAQPHVIITEIMYNPASEERKNQTEWVEIANAGTEAIELKDWRLDDEDKEDWGKFSCTLAPGAVAVLINGDSVKEKQFRAAWDPADQNAGSAAKLTYQVIPVKWSSLGNSPGADDEVLQLRNDKDEVVCEVKHQGRWPSCRKPDGASIFLIDVKAANLSDGSVWRCSEAGKDGGRENTTTDLFNGKDIGSPGYVPGLSSSPPTPAAPAPVAKPDAPKPEEKPKDNDTIDY